ncbi:MAG: PIG-L family deacetylase [Candidatus Hydrogenedentes bacterium]|nr:PIG-L family deacetylase [Candidatus Hydrogenedentota bacterium]
MDTISRREAIQVAAIAGASVLPLTAEAQASPDRKLKVVVAGGHPDDPESGCGGLIALYAAAGHEVVNLYLTRGEAGIAGKTDDEAAAIRTAEAEAACKILGARPVFAGQIDGAAEVSGKHYETIRRILDEEKPDLVLTHWPIDTHRDHRAASLLVYDAWLASGREFTLYYYEVESGHQSQHFHATHYVDITSVESKKREACYSHKSQNPDDFYGLHTEMHRFRGMESGAKFAEAYIRLAQNRSERL